MAVTNTQLAQYALATFGIAPGGFNTLLNDFANANGEVALLNALLKLPASPFGNVADNGAFSSLLVENVIGSTAASANKDWLVTLITSNLDAGASRGQMVKALVEALGKVSTSDATWGKAAATFTNKVTVGEYYTTKNGTSTDLAVLTGIVSSVTENSTTVTTAKSGIDNGYAGYSVQNLTTSTDTVTGTSGNDMFLGALGTVANTDSISDSSTSDADILTATLDAEWTPAKLAGVETVNLTGKYGTASLVGTSVTGVKQLNLDSSIAYGSGTVTGAGAASIAAVKAGTNISSLSVTNSSSGGAVSVDAGAATAVTVNGGNAADTFSLTLNGGSTSLKGNTNIEALTLTSKGNANTVTVGANLVATATPGTVTLKGDKALTLSATSSAMLTGVTVTDSADSGVQTTTKITGTADGNDLSKVATDLIELTTVSTADHALTFANNANVKLSLDSTGAGNALALTSGVTTKTETLNLSVNSSATSLKAGTNVFGTVNLSADQATTVTGTFGANTSVNVTGSKDVTFAATSTAKSVDASALTGKLTVAEAGIAGMNKVIGSAQADAITFGTTIAAATTVTAGAGDDTITIGNAGGNVLMIDGGTGSDTLKLSAAANFNAATVKDSVITGFETIDVNGKTLTLTQKQLFTNGNTFTLSNTASSSGTLKVVDDGASSKVFDLSTLTFDVGVAAPTINITGHATLANNIKGSAAADSITGGAGADSITGGAGNDTIDGGAGNDTIAGGDGSDTLTTQGTVADTAFTNVTSVEFLSVGTGAAVTLGAKAQAAGISNVTLTVNGTLDASAMTSALTVSMTNTTGTSTLTSGSGNDTITGGAGDDNINGGAGNDVITGGAGADVVSGGTDANTFVFAAGVNGAAPSATVFDTISDWAAGTGNKIDFGSTVLTLVAEGTKGSGQAAISATGLATFDAADNNLAKHIVAVEKAMTIATAVAGETAVWAEGSDSYIFISDGAAGVDANDVLIKITGVAAATGLTLTSGDISAIA